MLERACSLADTLADYYRRNEQARRQCCDACSACDVALENATDSGHMQPALNTGQPGRWRKITYDDGSMLCYMYTSVPSPVDQSHDLMLRRCPCGC